MMVSQPFPYITPSTIPALEKCFLQAAFRVDSTIKTFQPPPARLGRACHGLLERVANRELANLPAEEWLNGLEAMWEEEITKQETALLAAEREKHFGKAETWPRYAIQKSRVFLKAEKLLSYQHNRLPQVKRGVNFGIERSYTAFEGRLCGRADVVYESARGVELVDYKTGKIFDEDENGNHIVKEKYRQQLNLYAAMHHDCTGVWPVRGHLVPLTGSSVSVEIDKVEAGRLVQSAMKRMRQFNALVSESVQLVELANPSFDACYTCNYKAHCPAFWTYLHDVSDWGMTAHLEVAILNLRENHHGGFVFSMQVTAGTLREGIYDCFAHRSGGLTNGKCARLVNVRIQQDADPLVLKMTDYTTIHHLAES